MIKRGLKVFVVLILIMVMNAFNVSTLASIAIAVSDELESQTKTTNIANVELDAFYKDGESEKHSKELSVGNEETLYLRVRVKDKVSISSAKLKLENVNFKIVKDKVKASNYVKNIDDNTNEIELNPVSSNNEVLLELPIQFKKESPFTEDYFDREQVIKLEGKYADQNQKEKDLSGEVKIHTKWSKDVEVTLNQYFDKYFSLGEQGVILQQNIETEVKDDVLPIKDEKLEIDVPALDNERPEQVVVLANGEEISGDSVQYDKDNSKLVIENKCVINEDGKINWGQAKIEYAVIYRYNSKVALVDRTIKMKTKDVTTVYAKDGEITQENEQDVNVKQMGSVATIETSLTGDIYKGYMYAGSGRDINYEESNKIEVSYKDGVDKLVLNPNNEVFLNEEGNWVSAADSTVYKNTIVNKEEMKNVLGENGVIYIKNDKGEEISQINKDSGTDEHGNVNIGYPEQNNNVIIETTKPEKEGILTIKNIKGLKGSTGYGTDIVKQLKTMQEETIVQTNISTEKSVAKIDLKEPTTEIRTEVNRDSLSTLKSNKDVEIKVTLKSNQEKFDLYKNPVIELVFPGDVTDVVVNNINLLYGDEFKMKAQKGVVDGKQAVKIILEGEQTEYKDIGIDGTTIVLNAELVLNNTATTKEDNIITRYSNEKATSYRDENAEQFTKIQIVSPKGLIATNKIEDFGIETIGEDKMVSQELERSSSEKQIEVKSEIINNNENAIKDVKILGEFGTDGKTTVNGEEKENNVNEELKTALQVSATDTNKIKVYYTENENATNELEKEENGWQEEITDARKTRKYLITVTDMQPAEKIETSYQAEIAGGLEYNQQNYQGYMATYTESDTGTDKMVEATDIELKTGPGPDIETKLTARVGNKDLADGAEVKAGEVIKYVLEVTNVGNEGATNINFTGLVPEGTVLVKPREATPDGEKEDFEYGLENYYDEVLGDKKTLTIESLRPEQTQKVSYEVRVKNEVEDGKEISNIINYTFSDIEKQSNEVKNILRPGKVRVTMKRVSATEGVISGKEYEYGVMIENITDEKQENIKLSLNIPELSEIVSMRINDKFLDEIKERDLIIQELDANSFIYVYFTLQYKEALSISEVNNSAIVNYENIEYYSNEFTDRLWGVDFDISKSISKKDNLEPGDEFEYTIKVTNTGRWKASNVIVKDKIHDELNILEVRVGEEEKDISQGITATNEISEYIDLDQGESKEIVIRCQVNPFHVRPEDLVISNKAELTYGGITKTSNEVTSIMEKNENPNQGGSGGEIDNPEENPSQSNYIVSGMAWEDTNKNGRKDGQEPIISNVVVNLVNVSNNQIERTARTDTSGRYVVNNVENGDYLVAFEYDNHQYKITQYKANGVDENNNSDVVSKQLNIDGVSREYAVTDTITVNNASIANIDIGLIKVGSFDMQLDKTISRISVVNKKGTKVYKYDNTNFAKIEIKAQDLEGSTVAIDYNIIVKNNGELDGYIRNIADYLPNDVEFNSQINKDWYKEGDVIYNKSLANTKIAPGETKVVTLTVTKKMNKNNTGTIINIAEIAESYNEEGMSDMNSVAGNRKDGENDQGKAEIIISIGTGGTVWIILGIVLAIIILLIVTVVIIKKKRGE